MCHLWLLLIAIILSFDVVSGLCLAQDGPLRLPLIPEEIAAPKTDWYGVYAQGKKIGYAKVVLTLNDKSENPHYLFEAEMNMKIVAGGKKQEIVSADTYRFDITPPYSLYYARHSDMDGLHERSIEISRSKNGFNVILTTGTEKETKQIPAIEYTLADELTVDYWFKQNPGIDKTITVRVFDITKLRGDTQTVKVLSAKNVVINGVRMTCYEASLTSPARNNIETRWVNSRGNMLSTTFSDGLELRLEAEESATNTEYSEDLFLNGMAYVDKPLGDPAKIKELVVEVMGDNASKIPDGPRQSIELDKGFYILKTGQAHGKLSKATPEEVKENLNETIDYPIKHPKITEIAKKAIGEADAPLDKVKRLISFVRGYLKYDLVPGTLPVFNILSERKGDCSEHALLFTTLARAAGMPAREVRGLAYMGDDALAFGSHAWNEVVVNGEWLPVDSTYGGLEVDAAHIRLPNGGSGNISFRVILVNQFELSKEELKNEVYKLLREHDTIKTRRAVDKVYALGNIYEKEGNDKLAIGLYKEALRSNPWNLEYQLRLAKLQAKNANKDEAIDKASLVYDLAENVNLANSAKELLKASGIEPISEKTPIKVDGRIEIVLVPLGDVDERIVAETRGLLEKKMGIKFSIQQGIREIGKFDRTLAWRYVKQVFESVKKELKEERLATLMNELRLTSDDLRSQENMVRLIRAYLEAIGTRAKRNRFLFDVKLANLNKEHQYNYSRLIQKLQRDFPLRKNGPVKGYLAITDKDLYDNDLNFAFGLALERGGYGIISYHRFAAEFNGEDQNRPRLITRTLKQALSSANFILGIPRCSNPNCARAYPNSLTEHDQKSDDLCRICRAKLDEYKSRESGN